MSKTDKIICITGATGDFGKAFIKRFQNDDVKFLLWGRSPEKLNALSEVCEQPNYMVTCDLSDTSAIEKAWQDLDPKWRTIDVLINNAGGAIGGEPANETSFKDWSMMIDINIRSLAHITHLALPDMIKRQTGHIINIGSIAGTYPYPGGHVYCAAKAFVQQFSLALRADLFDKNVRVTNIEPGMTETQFSKVRYKGDEDKAAAVYNNANPMQAEDIAQAVHWAATMPAHVNINRIEMMPTTQAPGPLQVYRSSNS